MGFAYHVRTLEAMRTQAYWRLPGLIAVEPSLHIGQSSGLKVHCAAAAVNQRACAGRDAAVRGDDFHHFAGGAAGRHYVFDDEAAFARFDLKASAEGHHFFLAFGEQRANTQASGSFVGDDHATERRSDDQINLADAGVAAGFGRKFGAQFFSHFWMLQHQRALQIARTVQAGGEQEVAFQQSLVFFKNLQDFFGGHQFVWLLLPMKMNRYGK
jgi:hypothetical protein